MTPAVPFVSNLQSIGIVSVFLVPFAIAGLVLISAGLGRSRSAAHCMVSALTVMGVAALVYCLWGAALEAGPALPFRAMIIRGQSWDWIGRGAVLMRGFPAADERVTTMAFLQLLSVVLAALIPVSAAMDRWRLGAIGASTALLAGFTYPLFAHWTVSGWLSRLGVQYGLGQGFIDGGGAASIHVVGGLTALSVVWIIGPRRGKYSHDGLPAAIPGHNIVFVLFGCLLALVGWIGLNTAMAIVYGDSGSHIALIGLNLSISAGVAALASLLVTRARFGRPDASLAANGWVGGLVATSAGAAFLPPVAAVLIGGIAGVLVTYAADRFEFWLAVDDAGGAISAHAVAGLWGLVAVTALAHSGRGQWLAQLVGIATLLGFVLPVTYGLNWLLDRVWRQRVDIDGERQGLDLYELGSGAYPEFAIHADEFVQR